MLGNSKIISIFVLSSIHLMQQKNNIALKATPSEVSTRHILYVSTGNIPYQRQNFTCIYKITSKINGKCYVGSAKHFGIRRRNHLFQLQKGTHHSIILQNHVNKYGIEDLCFSIIEYCEWNKEIIVIEQHFIDTINPEFNVLKIAYSTFGRVITKETRGKMVLSHLGKKPTLKSLEKRRNSCKEAMSFLTPEQLENRKKGGRSRAKKVICTTTGIIYNSMREAEDLTGADNVWNICNGLRKRSKGLIFKYA